MQNKNRIRVCFDPWHQICFWYMSEGGKNVLRRSTVKISHDHIVEIQLRHKIQNVNFSMILFFILGCLSKGFRLFMFALYMYVYQS